MLFRTNRAAILAHLAVKILANATEDLIKAARTYCRDQSIQATERDLQSVANEALQTRGAAQITQLTAIVHPNLLTVSRDLTNVIWEDFSASTPISSYDQTGVEGASHTASKIEDNESAQGAGLDYNGAANGVPVVTAGAVKHLCRVYIGKDADTTRFPLVYFRRNWDNAGLHTFLNTSTGAKVDQQATASGVSTVRDPGGDWWELVLEIEGHASSSSNRVVIFPAGGTVIGTWSTAATGSIIVGNAEVYDNRNTASLAAGTFTFTP